MTHLATLVDQRREIAAQLAGKDIEIAMALGDRDAAQRARKEMEAQIACRLAAQQCGCFFHDAGARDAEQMKGAPAHA